MAQAQMLNRLTVHEPSKENQPLEPWTELYNLPCKELCKQLHKELQKEFDKQLSMEFHK